MIQRSTYACALLSNHLIEVVVANLASCSGCLSFLILFLFHLLVLFASVSSFLLHLLDVVEDIALGRFGHCFLLIFHFF
jgi:hypothetical protein